MTFVWLNQTWSTDQLTEHCLWTMMKMVHGSFQIEIICPRTDCRQIAALSTDNHDGITLIHGSRIIMKLSTDTLIKFRPRLENHYF